MPFLISWLWWCTQGWAYLAFILVGWPVVRPDLG